MGQNGSKIDVQGTFGASSAASWWLWGRQWRLWVPLWRLGGVSGRLGGVFLPSWSLRLDALWQTFGSFEAHLGHFVEAFWRLLATFYAVLGELLEKT